MREPRFVPGDSYKSRHAERLGCMPVAVYYCHDDPFTICRLDTVTADRHIVRVYGLARRSILDKPNRAVGEQRAYGRAAIELVRAMKEGE